MSSAWHFQKEQTKKPFFAQFPLVFFIFLISVFSTYFKHNPVAKSVGKQLNKCNELNDYCVSWWNLYCLCHIHHHNCAWIYKTSHPQHANIYIKSTFFCRFYNALKFYNTKKKQFLEDTQNWNLITSAAFEVYLLRAEQLLGCALVFMSVASQLHKPYAQAWPHIYNTTTANTEDEVG